MIDEQITLSDLSERIHQMKIVIRIKEGSEERDVWPTRKRILEKHRGRQTGWPEKLKVQVEVNPDELLQYSKKIEHCEVWRQFLRKAESKIGKKRCRAGRTWLANGQEEKKDEK